jgi:hypothetical protein
MGEPADDTQELIEQVRQQAAGDRRKAFDALYRSMSDVARFGRTARFDYLTMVGKLGLAPIEPGSTYISRTGCGKEPAIRLARFPANRFPPP